MAFVQLVTHAVRPATSYRALELGIDPGALGLLAAAFALLPLFLAIGIGRAADRGYAALSLAFGSLALVVGCAGLVLWAESFEALIGWTILIGTGHIFSAVAGQALVAHTSAARLDSGFGLYTFFSTFGQTAGSLMLVFWGGDGTFLDTNAIFLGALIAAGAACLAAGLLVVLLRRADTAPERADVPVDLKSVIRASTASRRPLIAAIGTSMAALAIIDLVAVYLPAWGVERGLPATAIGLLLTVRSVAMMASRLALGRLARLIGRHRLLIWSTLLAAVTVALLIAPVGLVAAAALMAVSGFALGIGQPLTMAIVSAVSPPGTQGTWLSLRLAGNRAGQLVIPALAGASAGVFGVGGVFLLSAIALAATAVGAAVALRKGPGASDAGPASSD